MVSLSDYLGREQSYVKHIFLERYLETLVHKTASQFPHIVFVDGFAGPWHERKAILVDGFSESLRRLGKYEYVAETTILRPAKDRPLYCLFYATRHRTGIEVYRDCQVKALTEQSKTRATTKIKHAETVSGQKEIFQSLHDMGRDELASFLEAERRDAEKTLIDLTPTSPGSIRYERLWPQVLARHVVRRPDVNTMAAQLRKAGTLVFPDWEKGKRIPQSHYRAQRN